MREPAQGAARRRLHDRRHRSSRSTRCTSGSTTRAGAGSSSSSPPRRAAVTVRGGRGPGRRRGRRRRPHAGDRRRTGRRQSPPDARLCGARCGDRARAESALLDAAERLGLLSRRRGRTMRFALALLARSGRWIPPALLLVTWVVLVVANPGSALDNAANLFFAVLIVSVWCTERDRQRRRRSRTAISARPRWADRRAGGLASRARRSLVVVVRRRCPVLADRERPRRRRVGSRRSSREPSGLLVSGALLGVAIGGFLHRPIAPLARMDGGRRVVAIMVVVLLPPVRDVLRDADHARIGGVGILVVVVARDRGCRRLVGRAALARLRRQSERQALGMTWSDPAKVDEYVGRVGRLAPRLAGEAALVELLPDSRPSGSSISGVATVGSPPSCSTPDPSVTEAVAVDSSPAMLARARARFADEPRVQVRRGRPRRSDHARSARSTSS